MIKRYVGLWVWNTAEYLGINLGRLGPHVFAWMIGCKEYTKVEDPPTQEGEHEFDPYKD